MNRFKKDDRVQHVADEKVRCGSIIRKATKNEINSLGGADWVSDVPHYIVNWDASEGYVSLATIENESALKLLHRESKGELITTDDIFELHCLLDEANTIEEVLAAL